MSSSLNFMWTQPFYPGAYMAVIPTYISLGRLSMQIEYMSHLERLICTFDMSQF